MPKLTFGTPRFARSEQHSPIRHLAYVTPTTMDLEVNRRWIHRACFASPPQLYKPLNLLPGCFKPNRTTPSRRRPQHSNYLVHTHTACTSGLASEKCTELPAPSTSAPRRRRPETTSRQRRRRSYHLVQVRTARISVFVYEN